MMICVDPTLFITLLSSVVLTDCRRVTPATVFVQKSFSGSATVFVQSVGDTVTVFV